MKITNDLGYELNEREKKALAEIIEYSSKRGRFWIPLHAQGPHFDRITEVVISDHEFCWRDKEFIINPDYLHKWAQDQELKTSPVGSVGALFYPGASINHETLKHMLLYFDRVAITTPDEVGCHEFTVETQGKFKRLTPELPHIGEPRGLIFGTEESELVERVRHFNQETLNLRRNGQLLFLSPSPNVGASFFDAIQRDLNSESFVRAVQQRNLEPFCIGASKAFGFHCGALMRDRTQKGDPRIIQQPNFELMLDSLVSGDTARAVQILFEQFRDRIGGHYGVLRVSPELGASILLNHAIYHSHSFNLIPFTDLELFEELLLDKFRRSVTELRQNKELDLSRELVARRVLEIHLPRFEMFSFDDVLETKEKLHDELMHFQAEMAKFAAQVSVTPFDQSYEREIQRVIAKDIEPAIADLEAKQKAIDRKFLSKLIRGARAGAVPIVATLFAGMPLPFVLALSAGVITLEALWETRTERKELLEQNGLSFLLSVSKEAQ